jgi:hypothetical protein
MGVFMELDKKTELRNKVVDILVPDKEQTTVGFKADSIVTLLEESVRQGRTDSAENTLRIVMLRLLSIRRFTCEESGVTYFAGWDHCLDTLEMDIRELIREMGFTFPSSDKVE